MPEDRKSTTSTSKQGGSTQASEQRPHATPRPGERRYEQFMGAKRDETLARVEEGYNHWKSTRTYAFPQWLYGKPKGTLFRVECEDSPTFGETSYLEFDSGRTAFLSIDMQIDFAGDKGYVDVMGYPLENTTAAIAPIQRCFNALRGTDIQIVHTREGHLPDLSDAPYNKLLRSKIIGKGVGIGEKPEGGLGRLLTRGDTNQDIIEELYPEPGEIVVDKAGKGALGVSALFLQLQNLGVTHLVITGITTDVCVDTIMTQANDLGYWCLLLKDGTGATKNENRDASITMVKMQGGVFGWVSDSERFVKGLEEAGIKPKGREAERAVSR